MKKHNFLATLPVVVIVLSVLVAWLVSGCSSDSTGPAPTSTTVNMAISFSKAGTRGLFKGSGAFAADSLRIDSAVVVLSRIKFLSHTDSVSVDTGDAENDSLERDQSIVFKGPFVVHVRDTVSINFANQVLPAGTYDGIKFKIHRLRDGEHHEDSDERNNHPPSNDSAVVGSSVTVWGAVYKSGGWTSFTFNFNDELEFKIKGNFIVPASTSTLDIALNVNLAAWFKNPFDGSLLDPSDSSSTIRQLIRQAIRTSFGGCKGGHDRGDGHLDH